MKVLMLDGKIIDCKIIKPTAKDKRDFGFTKMATWIDKGTKLRGTAPVLIGKWGIAGDVKYREAYYDEF